MNRRGATIAIYLVFVVAILLSISAIFSFLQHSEDFGSKAQDNRFVILQYSANKAYIEGSLKAIMAQAAKSDFDKQQITQSASEYNLHIVGQGNIFDKLESGDFEISKSSSGSTLKVSDVLLFSQKGRSSIKNEFNIAIETNNQGEFIRFINN